MLALYFSRFIVDDTFVSMQLIVPLHSAVLAGVTALGSLVAYFWAPQKWLYQVALALFLLFALTTGTLLAATGVTASPFIALGMLVAIFAGLFGIYGLAPVALATNIFLALDLLLFKEALTSRSQIIVFLLAFELPIIVSWLLWHNKGSRDTEKEKAYNELARELNQVANKSEIVINGIQDGVVAIDGKGIIQLINPAAQKIIGWGKRDALGLDYHSVLKLENSQGNTPQGQAHPIQHVLEANESMLTNDLQLETSSGKKIVISLLASPVGQPGGGAIVVFRDITKEKAEEKQQAEFISTASHEMRTPVASIEGYLGLALNPQTAAIDDRARLYLMKAHEAAQHLGRLFQDLLDVSRAEDGRLRSNPSIVDVVAFTGQIVDEFALKAAEKQLVLLFKPGVDAGSTRKISPVYYAEVDNDHLREAVSNLVENAIKYTLHGDVTVDVTGDTKHITISVHDTGIGIPAEDVPHLFQKFYRVDNSDTREIGGTGLGLYLTRRLVEGMNGRIWVESEYQKGSTFYIEIPRVSHEEAVAKIEAGVGNVEAPVMPSSAVAVPTPYQAATSTTVPLEPSTLTAANMPPMNPQAPTNTQSTTLSPAPQQPQAILPQASPNVPVPPSTGQNIAPPQPAPQQSPSSPQPQPYNDGRSHLFIPPRR
ncbi:MAG TPA: ATP-binding protein [Verrucomicrobiae bacterium]|nr:ATP-binding protein [Verrucomicrobiae bacterium]